MKKSIAAVFSISLTAGTLYLTYSQVKAYLIKKMVGTWQEEGKKENKELTDDQVKYLKEELDKLYIWEVKWLASYSAKRLAHVPDKELASVITKLKNRNILKRINLDAVDSIITSKSLLP